jgi:flagellar protein FlbD
VIKLTRLNGQAVMVNADLIESVEPTPDTVITLVSGNKLIVREAMDVISDRIIQFKRRIYGPPEEAAAGAKEAGA